MLFTGELGTGGMIDVLGLSVAAGAVLGVITYRVQKSWYRDDRESAVIKGLIVGLLTAIPTNIPAFLYVPSGILGLVHLIRGK